MQTKASLPISARFTSREYKPRLTAPQRAIVDWAGVDDHQAVLDASCSDAGLLFYYTRNFNIRACGMVSDPSQEENARCILGNTAEIIRADAHDIPWRDDSFHSVFLTAPYHERSETRHVFEELKRVLRPEGHLLISVACTPIIAHLGIRFPELPDFLKINNPYHLMDDLQASSFTEVSMRVSRLNYATVIAKKPSVGKRISLAESNLS